MGNHRCRNSYWAGASGLLIACAALFLILGSAGGQGTPPPGGKKAVDPPAEKSPLDEPISWLKDAKRNYAAVKDYTCTLVKKENVGGKLSEEHIVNFKFREQPFSVYMRWLAPKEHANTEVAFIMGKNNNKMRVHGKGFAKIAGWVTLDINDKRVLEHSRHNILEAGIGNLIDQTIKHWEIERKINKTEVTVAEYKYDDRVCLRIETKRPEHRQEYYCYRNVIYIDKESKIPIRTECYDWPRQGGAKDGELMEMFSFVSLRFNVNLTERDFDK